MANVRFNAQAAVLKHLKTVGSISIREAMDDYGLSGGHVTKIVSLLKASGHAIHTEQRKHPISGRRYARYHYIDAYSVAAE